MANDKTTQTTVFKADISQFKNAISEAERSLKLARSEFEVAAAKADKLGDATASLAAQEDLLKASISAAEQKIAAYKGQIAALNDATEKNKAKLSELADTYAKVVEEQGASSDEAKKLKKAMEDLKKEVNGNDAQIVKLTTTMNRTQAEIYKADKAMSDLKNSMDDTADKTKDAEKETKNLEKSEKKLENQQESLNEAIQKGVAALGAFASKAATVGVNAIKTGIDQAIKGFAAYTAAATAAAAATVGVTKAAAEYADEVNTQAAITGMSTEQIQKLKYASDVIDVSFETVSGSMAKLTKNMAAAKDSMGGAVSNAAALAKAQSSVKTATLDLQSAQLAYNTAVQKSGEGSVAAQKAAIALEKAQNKLAEANRNVASASQPASEEAKGVAAAFKTLGVAVTDSAGNLRSNQDVFQDTITALGKISNETERDALAMQIFGKSAQELNPLILGGADKLKELGDEADRLGLILSQDALDHLNNFGDSMDIFKAKAASTGRVIAGVFAGGLTDLTTTISDALPSLGGLVAKLFSGEDIGADLDVTLTQLGNTLLSKIANGAPKLLNGFNKILSSLFYSVARNIPAFMSAIGQPMLDGFVNLVSMLIANAPLLINNLRDSVIPAVLSAAVSLVTTLTEALPTMVPLVTDAALQLLLGLLDAIGLVIPPLLAQLPMIVQTIANAIVAAAPMLLQTGFQVLMSLIIGITQAIPQLVDAIVALIPIITETLLNKDNLKQLIKAAIELAMALIKGFYQIIPAIYQAIPEIMASLIEAIFEIDWLDVGWQLIKAVFDGVYNGIKSLGKGVVKALKNLFGGDTDISVGVSGGGLTIPTSNLPTSLNGQNITNNNSNTINYYQNNYSPKALDSKTIYRQSKTLINNFAH